MGRYDPDDFEQQQQPPPENEVSPEADLGRQVFGALGVELGDDDRDGRPGDDDMPPDFGWGPEPGETETWAGVERRRLLSDWVRKGDPRGLSEDGRWDPERGHLLEFHEGEGGEESGFGGGRGPQNFDGLFDMDSMHDPEMRHALNYGVGPLGTARGRYGRSNPGYGPQPGHPTLPPQPAMPLGGPALPREAVRELGRRFRAAEARAISIEKRASGGVAALMPSVSAQRWASDSARIARVFDPHTRVNDVDRAMQFFGSHPDAVKALRKVVTHSSRNARRQLGDHARDVLERVELYQTRPSGAASSKKPTIAYGHDDEDEALGSPLASRRRVGRRMRRGQFERPGRQGPRAVRVLEVPVFSRAAWSVSRPDSASGSSDDAEDDPPEVGGKGLAYYVSGNERFLAARMGMSSKRQRDRAELDAISFFKRRFGLDFSTQSGGAKRDPKTGIIRHASLPAVLEPYTVSAELDSRVRVAEGHLASGNDPEPDPLGNGVRRYAKDGDADRTSVSEAGWMVRPTAKEGVQLGVKARGQQSKLVLPHGGTLSTGFWILERPDAPPALMRFQSAGPPQVSKSAIGEKNTPDRGVRHEITSRWDVYDMAHDAGARPGKGALGFLWWWWWCAANVTTQVPAEPSAW